jgi:hypothetical protein
MDNQTVEALRAIDKFLRNCLLLFEDFVAMIKDRTLKSASSEVLPLELSYQVGRSTWSGGSGKAILEHAKRHTFGFMLLKTPDDALRTSDSFKEVCGELNVDPVFPMILVAGVLVPKDPTLLRSEGPWYRRAALDDTVLLANSWGPPPKPSERTEYKVGAVTSIKFDESQDWRRCQEARFRIWPLDNIPDSAVLEQVADEVLRI